MKTRARLASFAVVATILVALPCVAQDDLPSVDAVVDQVMEAYGGSEAWKKIVNIKQTGHITSTMRGATGETVRSLHYPDALQVDIRYPNLTESRTFAHGIAIRNGEQVSGIQLTSMILQAARLSIPKILEDGRDRLLDGGIVTVDEAPRRQITLPMSEGMSLIVYVDPETGRVTRSVGRAPAAEFPNGYVEFAADYSDFRMVEGALFPFREINYAQGMNTGVTTFETIEYGDATAQGGDKT